MDENWGYPHDAWPSGPDDFGNAGKPLVFQIIQSLDNFSKAMKM